MKTITKISWVILNLFVDVAFASSMVSDKTYLTKEQYNNASNYQRRLEVFKYGNQPPILEWAAKVHEHAYDFNHKKILEIGAGTCEFWEHTFKRDIKPSSITITDISQGMLNDCQKRLGNKKNIAYDVADIDHLQKYPSASFDIVIAHFVIYHAQNPEKALKELHRIIKPQGLLALAVVDEASSEGLWKLGHLFDERVPTKGFTSVFCEKHIEQGALLKHFSHCDVKPYRNRLSFPMNAKHVPIDSFRSSPTIAGLDLSEKVYKQMDAKISEEIKNKGAFEYDYLARLYMCEK